MEKNQILFQTNNLNIKKGDVKDAEKYQRNLFNDAETFKYMLWTPTDTPDKAREKVEKWIKSTGRNYFFMYEKSTNQPVGFLNFTNLGNGRWGEISLRIGKMWSHKGYGNEAMEFIENFAREKGGKVIEYSCLEQNTESKQLAKKRGFKQTFSKDKYIKNNNQTMVEIVFEKQL